MEDTESKLRYALEAFIAVHESRPDVTRDDYHYAYMKAIEAVQQEIVVTPDDYIDWSKVPKGYDWAAVDNPTETKRMLKLFEGWPNNKGVGIYSEEPYIVRNTFWASTRGNPDDKLAPNAAIIGPLPPWRKSLRKRPGK